MTVSPVSHWADPPPLSSVAPEGLYCLHATDVECGAQINSDDPNYCGVALEILNWTSHDIAKVVFSLSEQHDDITIDQAYIDANGRPIGPLDNYGFPTEGAGHDCCAKTADSYAQDNFDAVMEGSCQAPAKCYGNPQQCGRSNDWTVTSQRTNATFEIGTRGTPLPARDLVHAETYQGVYGVCDLVPGCSVRHGQAEVCGDGATVDNTIPGMPGGAVDNVLDGFVLFLNNFRPGMTVSLNWQYFDSRGSTLPIANPYNNGNFTIHRPDVQGLQGSAPRRFKAAKVTSFGPALWAAPHGFSRGTHSHPGDIFEPTSDGGHHFEVEFGAGLIAPYAEEPPPGMPPANARRIGLVDVPALDAMGSLVLIVGLLGLALHRLRRR